MPRKDFQRDFTQAAIPGNFPHLSAVKSGDHDGSISFTFKSPLFYDSIDFQAIVSDSSDYPKHHEYFVFATSDNVPAAVTAALENAQLAGSSVQGMLSTIDALVDRALSGRDSQTPEPLEDGSDFSASDDEPLLDDDEMDWEESSDNELTPLKPESELRKMIRRDLRAVRNAGFKVGYLGAPTGSIIICVSCRIGKLGISAEAMQAWKVNPSEYLVLLIRYPSTYLDLKAVLYDIGDAKSSFMQMHVGLCNSYKPSLEDALQAFQGVSVKQQAETRPTASPKVTGLTLNRLFIDRPLKTLLNERFLKILGYRLRNGFSWTGAELYYQTNQGKIMDTGDALADEYFEPDSWASSTPDFLSADHMTDTSCEPSELSLPLLAMQFTLRHFVKCTEFCLVCHCRTGDSFEALKPYVCSNGLCLYQYIALGMGPSLEYEIRSQPNVVDMLISLTYARAASGRLEDFPTGLGLMVPESSECAAKETPYPGYGPASQTATWCTTRYHTAKLKITERELHMDQDPPVKVGDWIAIIEHGKGFAKNSLDHWHCRVQSVDFSHHIQLSDPISRGQSAWTPPQMQPNEQTVRFVVYDKNFDDLTAPQKREMIPMLLDTLPNIDAMNEFLGKDSSEMLLSSWRERISPAALDVLRWIVASNRSCIMQDDENDPAHLVSGMENYMQFRLAQGAPDKEQRFVNAVQSIVSGRNPKHPTLFAWHGSPLYNWHSILREGLYFKEVANGRAYGNGVYLSNHFTTSLGYTGTSAYYSLEWPRSKLKIRTVISLNEVVNAPEKFVHSSPHYVVQQLDWIQPRYLFVPTNSKAAQNGQKSLPADVYDQDPSRKAHGPQGGAVAIPISALSSQRRQALLPPTKEKETKSPKSKTSPKNKKRKRPSKGTITPPPAGPVENDDDDAASVATAFDDIQILLSDDEDDSEEVPATMAPSSKKSRDAPSKTDFEPGMLTEDSLPLLTPPEYATTSATKALQQHLKATLKVQQKEPLHQLGWHVDPNLMSTVYQWIVELHSFDATLPLAKDLKNAKLTSVVLELRFPPRFPMAPPFVRVIRPRFLEFNNGGGGHVTAGGAMCMELLTNSGWLPTASIESVLLQVRMAITNMEPRPARLALGSRRMDYSVGEAVEAYKRACMAHGWEIPEDIQRISWA
ncbi:hypothetical protein ASPWEDRAFT_116048 [Aspergillus wentii DTO 134E9]|uniref:UBC core domain-containing protein n=1 Tax=Aspergillus wentii DTO 134E9 TaxID=1073089 RepID=A0A1L9REI7_ASPWE|nr:uncharacterized protein ASPWEDRAFT_116048 [Aspergillus wentii DTO 134E9]KAI9933588.1 hypothetical protein MW887_008061 [Aspergillus wentii]OJJ33340.1 hypothetical protein ASPWEDRAFT_116048 [Aspergillus wentii DTO 134E9]